MDIFISWSGTQSKHIATALRGWIRSVIHQTRPWMSDQDISMGARWGQDIAQQLEKSDYGVICLTKENLSKPWVLFESGAIAKRLGEARVCPLLYDLEPSSLLGGPLGQFQAARVNKADIFKMMKSIHEAIPACEITVAELEDALDIWWPRLERALEDTPTTSPVQAGPQRKSTNEILEDLLDLVRSHGRDLADLRDLLTPGMLSTTLGHEEPVSRPKPTRRKSFLTVDDVIAEARTEIIRLYNQHPDLFHEDKAPSYVAILRKSLEILGIPEHALTSEERSMTMTVIAKRVAELRRATTIEQRQNPEDSEGRTEQPRK